MAEDVESTRAAHEPPLPPGTTIVPCRGRWSWLRPESATVASILPPRAETAPCRLPWFAALALFAALLIPVPIRPLVIADDARQQIMPYLSFHHPEVLRDCLIRDYMYAYTTVGHKALYYLLTYAMNPFAASLLVTVALLAVMVVYFCKLGDAAGLPAAGAVLGLLLLKSPLAGRVAGGLPRSFAPMLALVFLYYFLRGSERGILIVLLLAAAFYPPVLAVCAAAYVLWLLWDVWAPLRGDSRLPIADLRLKDKCEPKSGSGPASIADRKSKIENRFVGRLVRLGVTGLVCLLFMAPNLRAPDFVGRLVTVQEAARMPEWGPEGRFPQEFPFGGVPQAIWGGVQASFDASGAPSFYLGRWAWLRRPFCLLWLGVGLVFLIRRPGRPVLAKLLFLGLSSTLLYVLACAVAFRLFLPSRMIFYAWPIVTGAICCLGLANAPAWRRGARSIDPRPGLLLALLFSSMLIYGPGVPRRPNEFSMVDLSANAALYDFFRTCPQQATIAGDPGELDNVMSMAARRAYVTYESAHPLYDRYYAEIRRRMDALHAAYFAADIQALRRFLVAERIDYLLANHLHFLPGGLDDYLKQMHGMQPDNRMLRERLANVSPDAFVLGRPDLPGVVFVHGPWFVVEAKAFLRATAAGR